MFRLLLILMGLIMLWWGQKVNGTQCCLAKHSVMLSLSQVFLHSSCCSAMITHFLFAEFTEHHIVGPLSKIPPHWFFSCSLFSGGIDALTGRSNSCDAPTQVMQNDVFL